MKKNFIIKFIKIHSTFIFINLLIILIYSFYIYNYSLFYNDKLYSYFYYNFYFISDYNEIKILQNNHNIFSNIFYKNLNFYIIIIITIFLFLFLISFYKTAFLNPGYLPNSPIEYELINIINKNKNYEKINSFIKSFNLNIKNSPLNYTEKIEFEKKINNFFNEINEKDDEIIKINKQNFNLCQNCLRLKIERTHHCKICNKCVFKMDHHCPYIGNCIGKNNYKFYILTIFYGFLLSFLICVSYIKYIFFINRSTKINLIFNILNNFCFMLNVLFLGFDIYLFKNNFVNVIKNRTTIEKAQVFNSIVKKNEFKYDKGLYENLKIVFGNNIFFWFLPY